MSLRLSADALKGYPQVWDAATGVRKYTFEGHQAPVYSVCPHQKGNIQVFRCQILLRGIIVILYFISELIRTSSDVT